MKHLVLEGSARERGLTHGKAWPQEIHEFAQIRKGLLKTAMSSWSDVKINKLLKAHLAVLKKDPELWDEFCGIAEGAEISHEDLMILNNHTDLRDFGDTAFDENLLECSCFAFKNGKKIIAGQTWDMHGSAKPFVAHLKILKDRQVQEVFTLTGCLGLTGVTSHKLGVFINNLRSREVSIGYAWPTVVRKLLDCTSLLEAKNLVSRYLPSAGRNFLIVDSNSATNLEVTAKRTEEVGNLSSGYLIHTNHYLSSLQSTEELSSRSKTTLNRYTFLDNLASKLTKTDLDLKTITDNVFSDSPNVLSIPLSSSEPHNSATCGGLVYDFEAQTGTSFEGLYSEKNHLKLKL